MGRGLDATRIIQRLDQNGDGMLDATEAAAMTRGNLDLMLADADGDGLVTSDELETYLFDQSINRMFTQLDSDGNGVLDATEIAASRDPARLQAADADGDGSVTLAELTAHAAAQKAARDAQRQAFQAADADGDHKLSASEWPATATATHADVDADGDGLVTGQELHAWTQANGAPF